MKYFFVLFASAFFLFSNAQDTTKILFIGNSHTFVNDLPQVFYQLATRAGKNVFVDDITMGGATLQMHLQNPSTAQKINEKHWDYVILQEQSQIPSFVNERDTMMYPYAILLDSMIHANWLCTNTLFFMTWAHKNGDLGILQNGGDDTFEDMQQRLRSGYLTIADSLNAMVAPCGWVWRDVIMNNSSIELFSSDGYHPAESGTYLAACTFFATIFRESPIGIDFFGNLQASDAGIFQHSASKIVLDSIDLWNIGLYNPNPSANFSYTQYGNNLQFYDSSMLANDFLWDFGDGTTSSLQNPNHLYESTGTYFVRLIVHNNCNSDTIIKEILITATEITNNLSTLFAVSPNPFKDDILIENYDVNQIADISIFALDGTNVFEEKFQLDKICKLNLSNLKNGIYFLRISNKKNSSVVKIVKTH